MSGATSDLVHALSMSCNASVSGRRSVCFIIANNWSKSSQVISPYFCNIRAAMLPRIGRERIFSILLNKKLTFAETLPLGRFNMGV